MSKSIDTYENDPEAWCDECGWASETARDLNWEGAKPTCPVCETWAEVS